MPPSAPGMLVHVYPYMQMSTRDIIIHMILAIIWIYIIHCFTYTSYASEPKLVEWITFVQDWINVEHVLFPPDCSTKESKEHAFCKNFKYK